MQKGLTMYTSGFTLIYKDEELDWLFQHPKKFCWWLWLRNHAASKPCIQGAGATGIVVHLQYGEVAPTLSYLKRVWNADERSIAGFLSDLEEEGRITFREEKGIRIIKIVQYERFSPPAGYFQRKTKGGMSGGLSGGMADDMQDEKYHELHNEPLAGVSDEMDGQIRVNIINKKTNKQENTFSDSSARERSFYEDLKKSDMTIEQMLYSLKPENGKEGLMQMLDEFINYCLGAEDYHDSFKGFKQHFMNWSRVQIRQNLNVKSKSTQNGQQEKGAGQTNAARRRGSEGSARTAADYEKPFSPPAGAEDD